MFMETTNIIISILISLNMSGEFVSDKTLLYRFAGHFVNRFVILSASNRPYKKPFTHVFHMKFRSEQARASYFLQIFRK